MLFPSILVESIFTACLLLKYIPEVHSKLMFSFFLNGEIETFWVLCLEKSEILTMRKPLFTAITPLGKVLLELNLSEIAASTAN